MNRLTTLACVAVCLLAKSAAAQLPAAEHPRLEMSIGFTGMSRGPGEGVERAMNSMGLQSSEPGKMTYSDVEGFWKIEIGTSDRGSIGVLKSRVANRSNGHGEISAAIHAQINTRQIVVTRAVTWSYRPNGWISVGAGPALHVRRFVINAPGLNVGVLSKRLLGAVAGVNVKLKRENGMFAHGLWQYRYAGSVTTGTVSVPTSVRSGARVQSVQWPSTKIPFSHRMVGIGLGVEF